MFGSRKTPEEKAAQARLSKIRAAGASLGITVMGGKFRDPKQMDVPIDGATVSIELQADAEARIKTRPAVVIGQFSVMATKDKRQLFITIEGADGSVVIHPVPAAREDKARIFAALVNGHATGVTNQAPPE